MSFYLLSKRDYFHLHSTQRIIHAQVYRLDKKQEVVIAIGNRGELICCDITGKQLARTLMAIGNSNCEIFQVERLQDNLYVLSQKEIYFANLQNLIQRCKNDKTIQLIPITMANQKEERFNIHKLTNKQIKVIRTQNQWFIKLSGRLKNQISYKLFSVQHPQIGNAILQYEFQQHFDYQFITSLQSLSKDIIIYQASITKYKPITLFSLQITKQSQGNSGKTVTDALLTQHVIVQFKQRLTITQIQKINYSTICVIGSSHFQADYSSVVILYNLKLKYTMNTINIKDTLIINTYLLGNQHQKDYQYGDSTVFIDAIGQKQDNTNTIAQIYPYCHFQTAMTELHGTVVNSQSNFLFYKPNNNPSELGLYSKIDKKALYCMLLKPFLSAANPKFYHLIIDLL